ncbi:SulP family inorganic anion transporter [Methanoplanus sp. FWC-SCC4]|uniref:SulP family inorganic anion transporter n=1 Tax=Methanochimaera problematica TaxID=2609417 RepID=A0AA97FFS2_9EURY|nr:SulP family inorganic anion transporter [Methanoplanus sp. FWC-SCC4]WOF16641.1 SulP family inorganic anion transporter [Methanoplanus sp. FWC-SCC4]
MNAQKIKDEWFSNIRGDVLAGITVALALIPEAIAFSIIAGVDPMVGLYASFCIAVVISVAGGRPGMISAATGSMALVMVILVRDFGLEYLLAATILTGILQFALGLLKIGRFISFIPYSAVLGFVNSLAILIFLAQVPFLIGAPLPVYAMTAATIGIIWFLPRFTRAVPAPLIAIVLMTAVAIGTGLSVLTVGDLGTITKTLPLFHLPMVPLTIETLLIILPYSATLVIVGLLESLLTASIIDEMTDTKSDKNREVKGQGIANCVAGFFGGMAGCAMIGQSVINVTSGGRGRLSSMTAGLFLIFLIIVLGDLVAQIPMAALVGVMIMVAYGTFEWQSVKDIFKIPKSDAFVMLTTIAIVVYTHDLAKGVLTGVVIAALAMVWKMSAISVSGNIREDGVKIYTVKGQLFFGTMSAFIDLFDYTGDPEKIEIDFQNSHIWDQSAVEAIARVIDKYQQENKSVYVTGLDIESQDTLDKGYSKK